MARLGHPGIFISYARKDGTELANRLHDDIGGKFEVWIDTRRIRGGSSWTNEIEQAIDHSQVVLALLTHGSYISPRCRAEQLRSLRKGRRVIPPIAQGDADIPLQLETKNYRDFRRIESYDAQLQRLLEDISSGGGGCPLAANFRTTRV